MSAQSAFSLLAATRHIGWGGVGKLRLILERLPEAEIVLHGDDHAVAITRDFLNSHHRISERPAGRADVALVINDPAAANSIAAHDIPVVYVDSLPYVHRTDTDLPMLDKLAYYCAQKYPSDMLPLTSPVLKKWPDTKWIDPIVPARKSRRGGRGIVISMGGLYSYNVSGLSPDLVNDGVDAYLDLVLFPLVRTLQASHRTIHAVCGNINAAACKRLRAMLPECDAIGPQSPQQFERRLADADLLITSPGSTTILQAMSIDLPTLLLPPQNRSQFFNAKAFAKPGATVMRWPASILDETKLESLRSQGLSVLNRYIYESIIEAANTPDLAGEVAALIERALVDAPSDGVLNAHLPELGVGGAEQVAQLVRQAARGQQ